MLFVLHKRTTLQQTTSLGASGAFLADKVERWTWHYQQGSVKNPTDKVLCVSPRSYASEREARSAIAEARKAFGGARMAKVVLWSDIPSDD